MGTEVFFLLALACGIGEVCLITWILYVYRKGIKATLKDLFGG